MADKFQDRFPGMTGETTEPVFSPGTAKNIEDVAPMLPETPVKKDESKFESSIFPKPVQTIQITPDSKPPEPTIQISEPEARSPLPDAAAADRAMRARIAFPYSNMNYQDMLNALYSNQENPLRDSLSALKDREAINQNQQIIMQMAKERGKPFSLPEALYVQDILNKKRQNPNTVIEEGYAEAFIDNLRKTARANPDSTLAQAFNQIPGFVEDSLLKGKDYKARKELFYSYLQEAQAAVGKQSYPGYIADFLMFGIPGYQITKLTGLQPDTSFDIKLGNQLDAQAANWYAMPFDQFTEKSATVAKKLLSDNPQLAVAYWSAMLHQSQSDRVINNLLPAQDVLVAADLARAGFSAAQYIRMAREVRIALKDYLKAKDIPTGEVPLANAAGDTIKAGVKQITKEINDSIQGLDKPVDSTIRPFQTAFKDNVSKIVSDPTTVSENLGQEFVNRLAERNSHAYSDFIDRVINMMHVERIPALLAIEKNVQAMIAETVKQFPELDNSIMHVGFRKDGLGNLLADAYISRDGVSIFPTLKQAKDFAREHQLFDATYEEMQGPARKGIPAVNKFKTSQGSEYTIHPDGTTTRRAASVRPGDKIKRTATWANKDFDLPVEVVDEAPKPGPDGRLYQKVKYEGKENYVPLDELKNHATEVVKGPSKSARGHQPKSERTIYVTDEVARKLVLAPGRTGGGKILEDIAGKFSLMIKNKAGNFEGVPGQTKLTVSNTPAAGLTPLELWGLETVGKSKVYSRVHVGNPIVDITSVNSGWTIEPRGLGYIIVKTIPWTETNQITRDLLLTTKSTQTPKDLVNAFGGWFGAFRTPEDTLAYQNIVARKLATFGPNNFIELIADTEKEIRQLRGWGIPGTARWKMYQEWKRVMSAARQMPDPLTGEKGAAVQFSSPGDVWNLYQNLLKRAPTPIEIEAAFAYKRKLEFLKAFQQISQLNRYQRLGAMEWEIQVRNPAKDTEKFYGIEGVKIVGTRRLELPGSDVVLIIGDKWGDEARRNLGYMGFRNSNQGKRLAQNIKEGKGFLIELADPERFPLSKLFGEKWVRYVYTDLADSKLLDVTKMKTPKLADLDYDHYVVQPVMHFDELTNTWRYLGDKTIGAFNINTQAKDVAERLNTIRKLIQEDKITDARAFYDANSFPQSWSEIFSWFHTDVTTEGLPIRGPLNKQWDIVHVPAGKLSIDMGKDFERTAKSLGKEFADINKEKYGRFYDNPNVPGWDPFDVFTLRNEGTKANPLYNKADLKVIDPMTTINRAMSRAINNMWLEDYKIMSIEHWIQEAKDWLKADDDVLAQAPAWWFYNAVNDGVWKEGVGARPEIKNNLMTAHHQITQFLGIQDLTTTWLHRATSLLADSIYGKGKLGVQISTIPNYLLASSFFRDPFQWIRSMTFHAKVGLFNPAQLFVQSNTFATIWGIAGSKYAAPGTKAAMFHMWSRLNKDPAILDIMDKLASEFRAIPGTSRWLPGQWREAHDLLVNFGFDKVGAEHIFRDNTVVYDFIGTKGASFLSMSRFFFEEAERNVRAAAFYTAYREIRDTLKTTGRLTEAQARDVLQRADLLSGNMSRASSSALNKGVFSPMTQFASYYMRMAELMMGRRLTSKEKMRLYGTYAVFYGVPGAYGLSGLPIGDYIIKNAQEMGYVTGAQENSYFESFLAEGLPSLLLYLATGNWYNVQERYGLQGMEQIRDFLRSDKTFLDIIGGAGYSTFTNTIANFSGFYRAVVDGMFGEGHFPFKIEDAIEPLKEVSTMATGIRLYAALNTQRWLSKKEGYLSDVSPLNAIFMSLTGLGPNETRDIITKGLTRADERQAHRIAQERFIKEMHRAFREQDNNNYEQAKEYQSRAWHWLRILGYPEERYSEALSIATRDWESIIGRSNYDYYLRDVSEKRKENAHTGFIKWLKSRE